MERSKIPFYVGVSALEAAKTELEQEFRKRSEMEMAAFQEERRRMERQVRKLRHTCSAVQKNVEKGDLSTALLHATFDHYYLNNKVYQGQAASAHFYFVCYVSFFHYHSFHFRLLRYRVGWVAVTRKGSQVRISKFHAIK